MLFALLQRSGTECAVALKPPCRGLFMSMMEQWSSAAGGLGLEERPEDIRGRGVMWAEPDSLGPASAHCGLDRLGAREESSILRSPGLQLARGYLDKDTEAENRALTASKMSPSWWPQTRPRLSWVCRQSEVRPRLSCVLGRSPS